MSAEMLMFGFAVLVLSIARPLLLKKCTQYFSADFAASFIGAWQVIGVVIALPFLYHLIDVQLLAANRYAVIVSLCKGVALWTAMKFQQVVNKESTSSSVFPSFLVMALGSLIVNLYFDENLPKGHLGAMLAMGVLGVVYLYKGDIRRISKTARGAFYASIIFSTYCMVSDHVVIRAIGWYPHLMLTAVTMFGLSVVKGIKKEDYKNIITNKYVVAAGSVFVIGEFFIIYTSINIMPVSYVALFSRLASAIVMIISAIMFKEQTIKKQAAFGLLAFAFALVIIFT